MEERIALKDMTDEQVSTLLLAHYKNKPIQYWNVCHERWTSVQAPTWYPSDCYRVAPEALPFGELQREEQEKLVIAAYVDHLDIELGVSLINGFVWNAISKPIFDHDEVYRIKPTA